MRDFFLFLFLPFFLLGQEFFSLTSSEKIAELFPKTVEEIDKQKQKACDLFLSDLEKIVSIPKEKMNFENTCLALDQACERISIQKEIFSAMSLVCPDKELQSQARKSQVEMDQMLVEQFSDNRRLYYAIKDFVDQQPTLLSYQQLFIDDLLKNFEEGGHLLACDERKEVKTLLQEIIQLEESFDHNIQSDEKYLDVDAKDLTGLSEEFLSSCTKTQEGKYRLFCDYPTYFYVIDHCQDQKTRKAYYNLFMNRAYPQNEEILLSLIEKRNRYAQKVGYPSYAHLTIRREMAVSPKAVEIFLNNLSSQLILKEEKEFEEFAKEPIFSSLLNASGQINPWDYRYLDTLYIKNHFSLDQELIAQYFPLPHVLEKMQEIFGPFFGVTITLETPKNLWSEDLVSFHITDNETKEVLGYILLDLFPRPNKYSHACMMEIIPAKKGKNPSLNMIIANFPKAQNDKPSLLELEQVRTLFHEFGHAMHGILAKTELFSQSGTHVTRDFVEMPSQLLEEWAYDEDVLRKISSHYKTHDPLPQWIIETVISSRFATAGFFFDRQAWLSFLSLNYFSGEKVASIQSLYQEMTKLHRAHIGFDPDDHFPCSFGHLTGYGAKYYCYMWTRLMAMDLFSEIKKHHMDSVIGKRYRTTILEKGGSVLPKQLIFDFLKRETNQKAFLKSLLNREYSVVDATP